jgi:hypothetical protein
LPVTNNACERDLKNEIKKPQRIFWGIYMVPRDRIELPTRGFSGQIRKPMISSYYLISLVFMCPESWEMLSYFRRNEIWWANLRHKFKFQVHIGHNESKHTYYLLGV